MRIIQYIVCCLSYFLLLLSSSCTPDVPKEQSAKVLPRDLPTRSTEPGNETSPQVQLPATDSLSLDKTKDEKRPQNGTAIATSIQSATTPPKAKELANKIPAKKRQKKKERREKKVAGITFDNTTHPYGNIRQGDIIEHQFYFTNTGTAPLTITNVKASCGCTQPSYPFIPIEPGEKGYIGVTFNSKGKLGKQKPTITVITNASPSTYKLYLEGYVDTDKSPEEIPEAPSPKQETPLKGQ